MNPSELVIKFSKDYVKLPAGWPGLSVVLLGAEAWNVEDLPDWFKEFDTRAVDGTYYKLPERGLYIVLFLLVVGWPVFTTIRRSTPRKWEYYHSNVGKLFKLVRA